MAKDKSDLSKEERKALKAAKKADKSTLADAGVNGSSKHKSDKKEKKDKKKREALAERALNDVNGDAEDVNVVVKEKKLKDADVAADSDDEGEQTKVVTTRPIGALVPFAVPLADDKVAKKAFKGVKKASAQRTLKRGVKEVVKALRKSPTDAPANSGSSDPIGIVILAADISPMDVISHIPVLCEDHNIPYIFVQSRAELGLASGTKRPTSVVMVSKDIIRKKDAKAVEGADEWPEVYASLAKTVLREGAGVKR